MNIKRPKNYKKHLSLKRKKEELSLFLDFLILLQVVLMKMVIKDQNQLLMKALPSSRYYSIMGSSKENHLL